MKRAAGAISLDPDDGADMTVTVCEVIALRAAKNAGIYVPPAMIDAATAYIKRGQNPDGGFMYMIVGNDLAEDPRASKFPRSAGAVTALYAIGVHDGLEISRGLDYLMGFIPAKGKRSHMGYYYYGQYYAAQAFWQAGGRQWDRWFPAVRDDLIAKQLERRFSALDRRERGLCHGNGLHRVADAEQLSPDSTEMNNRCPHECCSQG